MTAPSELSGVVASGVLGNPHPPDPRRFGRSSCTSKYTTRFEYAVELTPLPPTRW